MTDHRPSNLSVGGCSVGCETGRLGVVGAGVGATTANSREEVVAGVRVGFGVVATTGLGVGVRLGVNVVSATEGIGVADTIGVAKATGLGAGVVGAGVGVASATGGVSEAIGEGVSIGTEEALVSRVVVPQRIAPAIPSATMNSAPMIVPTSILRFGRGAATGAGGTRAAGCSADAEPELLVGRAGVAMLSFSALQNSWQVRNFPSPPTHAYRKISLLD